MLSQVIYIYVLRLPGDCKFFMFKCGVNVTIKKKNEGLWTGKFGANGASLRFVCRNRFLYLAATVNC